MPDAFDIQSHKGRYTVSFDDRPLAELAGIDETQHYLVDANVARLYASTLSNVLERPTTIVIEAVETNKSIDRIIPVIEKLVANKMRRDHVLIAVGGGIIQDVTCFIASTLLRGVPWRFVPTTLLAQADSCIGSKSSINLGATKNILGTFYPPREIFVFSGFLDTLDDKDIRSGIGEILKVHAIEGMRAFENVAADYDGMVTDRAVLLRYVRDALLIKRRFIEVDEFDTGIRNVFNYGHSFGHAIESATQYAVPHGVAVTMGMDIANTIAVKRGLLAAPHHQRMHGVLRKNYDAYRGTRIHVEALMSALMKDKKNTATKLVLILPVGEDAKIQRVEVVPDDVFVDQCRVALEHIRS